MSDPAALPPASQTPPAYRSWRFWLPVLVIVAADQASKTWVANAVAAGGTERITVIPDFFYIIHVFNTGAAWSMFSGYGDVLGFIGIAAVLCILLFRKTFQSHRPALQWILGLLCGGILGNVIDRFRYAHVVDFIDLHFGSYRYPTFNIADSAICIGAILYIIWTLRPERPATGGNRTAG